MPISRMLGRAGSREPIPPPPVAAGVQSPNPTTAASPTVTAAGASICPRRRNRPARLTARETANNPRIPLNNGPSTKVGARRRKALGTRGYQRAFRMKMASSANANTSTCSSRSVRLGTATVASQPAVASQSAAAKAMCTATRARTKWPTSSQTPGLASTPWINSATWSSMRKLPCKGAASLASRTTKASSDSQR